MNVHVRVLIIPFQIPMCHFLENIEVLAKSLLCGREASTNLVVHARNVAWSALA